MKIIEEAPFVLRDYHFEALRFVSKKRPLFLFEQGLGGEAIKGTYCLPKGAGKVLIIRPNRKEENGD